MQDAYTIFTLEEIFYDAKRIVTGETRQRTERRPMNYSPDADPNSPSHETYTVTEQRIIYRMPDGREGETWHTTTIATTTHSS